LSFLRYIFPGVGLGAIAVEATSITDKDFFISAAALAEKV
jgi:malic enzyme